MPKDLNFDINADDNTKRPTDAAARNFENLQRRIDKTNTSKPSKEINDFSRLIDKSVKDGEDAFTSIQRSIDDTRTHITKLRDEFRTTGSSSIFGDLKGAQNDLRKLESIAKELGPNLGATAGKSFATGFTKSAAQEIPGAFSSAGPIGAAVAAGLLTVIAPAASAAVTAGVGLGLIGAAALIQHNNPQIVAAFAGLKTDAIATFKDASEPLVQPFTDAISAADQFIQAEGPKLRAMFASVAPAVGLIEKGLEHLASDLLPSLTRLGEEFTRVLKDPAVQRSLAGASQSFATLFNTIGSHPQEIAAGFHIIADTVTAVNTALSATISLSAGVLKGLNAAGNGLKSAGVGTPVQSGKSAATPKFQDPFAVKFPWDKKGTDDATSSVDAFNGAVHAMTGNVTESLSPAQALSGAMSDLATSMDTAFNSAMDLDRANLGLKQAQADLKKTLKENKDSWNQNTQAGRDDMSALLDNLDAIKKVKDAQDANGVTTDASTKKYYDNVDGLLATAKQAGLSKTEIAKLKAQYEGLPNSVTTDVHANTVAAMKALATFKNGVESIKTSKTFTLHVQVNGDVAQAEQLGRATGQRIALGARYNPGWFDADPGGKATTMPAQQANQPLELSASLQTILDGQTIGRSVFRSRQFAQARHVARVGRR